MRILINDKAVDELTPKMAKSLMLSKVQSEVKARVRTPAEATEFYVSQTKRWYIILGAVAVVAMAAISIAGLSYEPNDAPFLIVGLLIIIGALLLFMVLLLRHRVKVWNAVLGHELLTLPGLDGLHSLGFTPDGRRLVASNGTQVQLFDGTPLTD